MIARFLFLVVIILSVSYSNCLHEKEQIRQGTNNLRKQGIDKLSQRRVEQGYYGNGGNENSYDDDAYQNRVKTYVVSNMNQGYHSTPASWGFHQWIIFGGALFLFGVTFCLACSFCCIPCMCPSAGRGYVRMFK